MDKYSTKKRSLFDDFLHEIDNEYSDNTSNHEKSMGEMSDENDSTTKLQDTNSDESNNRHFDTVKYFYNYKLFITV